ncbi:hypothetical protein GQ54DRAFT_62120, partial [Martensiomyces pterosporus]
LNLAKDTEVFYLFLLFALKSSLLYLIQTKLNFLFKNKATTAAMRFFTETYSTPCVEENSGVTTEEDWDPSRDTGEYSYMCSLSSMGDCYGTDGMALDQVMSSGCGMMCKDVDPKNVEHVAGCARSDCWGSRHWWSAAYVEGSVMCSYGGYVVHRDRCVVVVVDKSVGVTTDRLSGADQTATAPPHAVQPVSSGEVVAEAMLLRKDRYAPENTEMGQDRARMVEMLEKHEK